MTNAAIPAKNYGFAKQKHIRGDKTLKILNFGPNVIYYLWGTLDKPRQVTKIYEFYVPVSALALGGRTKKHGLKCKCNCNVNVNVM